MTEIKNFEKEAKQLINNEEEVKQLFNKVAQKEEFRDVHEYNRLKTLIDAYYTARRTGCKVIEHYEQKRVNLCKTTWYIRKILTYRVDTADFCVRTFPDNCVCEFPHDPYDVLQLQFGKYEVVDPKGNMVEGVYETVEDDWLNADSCVFGNGSCEERMIECVKFLLWLKNQILMS